MGEKKTAKVDNARVTFIENQDTQEYDISLDDRLYNSEDGRDFISPLELNSDIDPNSHSLSSQWNLWNSFRTSFGAMLDPTKSFEIFKELFLNQSPSALDENTMACHMKDDSFFVKTLLAQTIENHTEHNDSHGQILKSLDYKIRKNSQIYSSDYHPFPREQNEMRILAKCISVEDTFPRDKDDTIYQLLFPKPEGPESVLLKHGAVSFRTITRKEFTTVISYDKKELILLNRGIIIASLPQERKKMMRMGSLASVDIDSKTQDETSSSPASLMVYDSILNKEKRRDLKTIQYESCFLFSDITCILDPVITREKGTEGEEKQGDEQCSIILKVKRNAETATLYINCDDETTKVLWLHALSWSYYHYSSTFIASTNILKGGHFRVTQTSLYSAAVRGDENILHNMLCLCRNLPLDEVDPYDGLSALHYAVMWNNLDFARTLLLAGASVDTLCQNNHCSPLYYGTCIIYDFNFDFFHSNMYV